MLEPSTTSNWSACVRCIASVAWRYVFAVTLIVEYPSAALIVLRSVPAARAIVAWLCRRS
jgi:hypothetical protein